MVAFFQCLTLSAQIDAQYVDSSSPESCFHIRLLNCELETRTYGARFCDITSGVEAKSQITQAQVQTWHVQCICCGLRQLESISYTFTAYLSSCFKWAFKRSKSLVVIIFTCLTTDHYFCCVTLRMLFKMKQTGWEKGDDAGSCSPVFGWICREQTDGNKLLHPCWDAGVLSCLSPCIMVLTCSVYVELPTHCASPPTCTGQKKI